LFVPAAQVTDRHLPSRASIAWVIGGSEEIALGGVGENLVCGEVMKLLRVADCGAFFGSGRPRRKRAESSDQE
jgi:hypothetical protein